MTSQYYNTPNYGPAPMHSQDDITMRAYPPPHHEGSLGPYEPRQRRTRSPSPTPSELAEVNAPLYDWSHFKRASWWLQARLIPYYIGIVLLLVGVALFTIYHKQIVQWLQPPATKIKDLKFGFLIPIAIFFVISFPPLFGHEILAVLCGLVWGLGIGFAIVCAGTFVGELGNFYAFKYCCRARAEKMEEKKPYYACLARVVREGGFKIALIARLSAIPGHFTTAVFSTCGMGVIVFSMAAILSLPKQFVTVYVGVMLEPPAGGTANTKQRIISDSVAAVSVVITFAALWWIWREMNRVKPEVFRERRRKRLARLNEMANAPYSTDTSRTRVGDADSIKRPISPSDSAESDVPFAQHGYPRPPAQYAHYGEVQPSGHFPPPGTAGQRWAEGATPTQATFNGAQQQGQRQQYGVQDFAQPQVQQQYPPPQQYGSQPPQTASPPQRQYTSPPQLPYMLPPPQQQYATPQQQQQQQQPPPQQHQYTSPPPQQFAPPPGPPQQQRPPAPAQQASAGRYQLSDGGPVPLRQENPSAWLEARPTQGTRHVSEATAYYSADEGEE